MAPRARYQLFCVGPTQAGCEVSKSTTASLNRFCEKENRRANKPYCVAVEFKSTAGCELVINCNQVCTPALDYNSVCDQGDDDLLWTIVCGAVFGGVMMLFCFMKHCCAGAFGSKLPTQSSTMFSVVQQCY